MRTCFVAAHAAGFRQRRSRVVAEGPRTHPFSPRQPIPQQPPMIESDASSAQASPALDEEMRGATKRPRLTVAITSPFVWPWVRRGSERMLHDLARWLVERGHRVSVYASGPQENV